MKDTATSGEKLSMKERYPLNISQDVFDAWQFMKRKKDAEKLMQKTGLSRPIIDRALKYGHINNDKLESQITNFFAKRYEKENGAGVKLLNAVKS
jgi:hypothetical protein